VPIATDCLQASSKSFAVITSMSVISVAPVTDTAKILNQYHHHVQSLKMYYKTVFNKQCLIFSIENKDLKLYDRLAKNIL
jgi:hypothetical protein